MALLKRKRSGLSDPMSVVTNFVNACNRHDAEGVSACLHPDFDSIQPMYPSRNFRGADQVRRNWQAIFDAEPGFRLTVLRSAAAGETVWLELHGAGRDAEVAGVFVMGIQADRIRWARIYSALVEDAPATTEEGTSGSPAPLRQVPPLADDAEWGDGATAPVRSAAAPLEEDLIAPVVDIDGNGRNRRGRGRRRGGDEVGGEPSVDTAAEEPVPVEDAGPVEDAVPAEDAGPVEDAVPVEDVVPVVEAGPVVVEAEPAVEEAAAALAAVPVQDEPERSSDPTDSIDPEAVLAVEAPAEGEGDAGGDSPVGPDGIVEPAPVGGPDDELVEATEPRDPTDVMVETMVEVDPHVVVEAEPPVEAGPEVFVELSIPEGAVDPDPHTSVTIVPDEPPAAAPGLIVTTPPPAAERTFDRPEPGGPRRKKRKRG